jgi:hypothetical protein
MFIIEIMPFEGLFNIMLNDEPQSSKSANSALPALLAAVGRAMFPLVLVSNQSSRLTHDLIFQPGEAGSQRVQGMRFTIHPLKTTVRWNYVDI